MLQQLTLKGVGPSITEYVDKYLQAFPNEKKRLKSFRALLSATKQEFQLYERKVFVGHITASAFILSRDRTKLLFLLHPTLTRFLQPGGHVYDSDLSILETAYKRAVHETGLSGLEYLPYHIDPRVPIDIDTHSIPANSKYNEDQHLHHDFRYLLQSTNDSSSELDVLLNATKAKWMDFSEAAGQATYKDIVGKIQVAISQEFLPRRFYNKVVSIARYPRKVNAVIVTHLLPDVKSYLTAISTVTNVTAVIPKPKSIVAEIQETVAREFSILDFKKNSSSSIKKLCEHISNQKGDFILFDIGGYFAPAIDKLAKLKGKILGIVEDTENGHQKYEAIPDLPFPVFSVARSPLKDNEDYLVGQSVVFSADSLLRDCGKILQYENCSVLGYGKIGRSIASHLLHRGVKPHVFDTNPIRLIHAKNHLCDTPSRKSIITNSDIIFCATGNKCLDLGDFRKLKNGCFVFSVTSSDDEFDTSFLKSEYKQEQVFEHIFKYSSSTHCHHFYFANRGNAVNFIHKAVLGNFIHLVRAEMITGGALLMAGQFQPGLNKLRSPRGDPIGDMQSKVCVAWLDVFNDGESRESKVEIKDTTI